MTDAWYHVRFHLDVMEEDGQMIINLCTGEIDAAAGDTVVGNAIGGALAVWPGTRQPGQTTAVFFQVNPKNKRG